MVAVLDLKTGERKTLVRGGRDAAYMPASTTRVRQGIWYTLAAARCTRRASTWRASR